MNKNNRDIIFNLLLVFFSSNKSFQAILDQKLKRRSRLDTNHIIYTSKGILRYKAILDFNISKYSKVKKIDKKTLVLLYIGIYELIYCDGIPSYATINTIVELSKIKNKKSSGFINAILRKVSNRPCKEICDDIKLLYPQIFTDKLNDQYGNKKMLEILKSNIHIPEIWLRINLLKTTIQKIKKILNNKNIPFQQDPGLIFFILINKFDNEGTILRLIKDGYLYVQNPASGYVVEMLNVKDGDSILDACSAPGGKASLLIQNIKENIDLTCMDINLERLKTLKNNMYILGIDSIHYICNDALNYRVEKKYNKIILDMPCSSSGTIRKNPDIKWKINKNIIKEFQSTQYDILNNMKNNLKINGEIIYCTCSIFNDENEYNITKFLTENNNFKIANIKKNIPEKFINKLGGITILPDRDNYEGIFAIKLIKDA